MTPNSSLTADAPLFGDDGFRGFGLLWALDAMDPPERGPQERGYMERFVGYTRAKMTGGWGGIII